MRRLQGSSRRGALYRFNVIFVYNNWSYTPSHELHKTFRSISRVLGLYALRGHPRVPDHRAGRRAPRRLGRLVDCEVALNLACPLLLTSVLGQSRILLQVLGVADEEVEKYFYLARGRSRDGGNIIWHKFAILCQLVRGTVTTGHPLPDTVSTIGRLPDGCRRCGSNIRTQGRTQSTREKLPCRCRRVGAFLTACTALGAIWASWAPGLFVNRCSVRILYAYICKALQTAHGHRNRFFKTR